MRVETISSAATEYRALWSGQDRTPDLTVFLQRYSDLTARELADVLLIDQAMRWRRGDDPGVEQYLIQFPEVASDPELCLDLAYGEFRQQISRESDFDTQMFLNRFPSLTDSLRRQIECAGLFKNMSVKSSERPSESGSTDLLDEFCDASTTDFTNSSASPPPISSTRIDDTSLAARESSTSVEGNEFARLMAVPDGYELLAELGRGGMGVVYQARERALDRFVALKVIRADRLGSSEDERRFENEALTAAQLDHPHIVPVFQVGQVAGNPFFTMKLIEGRPLSRSLEAYRDRPTDAVRLMIDVAGAIQHAHERGVLHRDLKPSNILVEASGHAWVVDFGLARLTNAVASTSLTGTNEMLGTPAFVAPECLTVGSAKLTTAADVYGLGAILYTLLTGQPPFHGTWILELLKQIQETEPVAPRRLVPTLARDLETICLKALAKEPARRYRTAREFGEDLQRYLNHQPVLARQVGVGERAGLWLRRHPVRATVVGSVLLTAMLLIGGAVMHFSRLSKVNQQLDQALREKGRETRAAVTARNEAKQHEATAIQERDRALQSELRMLESLYAADMKAAFTAARSGDMLQSKSLLDRYRPQEGRPDVRGFEWEVLQRNTQPSHVWAEYSPKTVHAVKFSPDGRYLAAGGPQGVQFYDATTLQPEFLLPTPDDEPRDIAFSPDGTRMAAVGYGQKVWVWDVATWQLLHKVAAFQDTVWQVVFTPDNRRLAACSSDQTVKIWRTDSMELLHTLSSPEGPVSCLAVSRDGRYLASGQGSPNSVVLWELDSGRRLATVPFMQHRVRALDFSHDSQRLAIVTNENTVMIFDLKEPTQPRQIWKQPQRDAVHDLEFSPDDSQLAVIDNAGVIRLWKLPKDISTPTEATEFESWQAHDGRFCVLNFSPNGLVLASGGADSRVKLWNLVRPSPYRQLPLASQFRSVTFAPREWNTSESASSMIVAADQNGVTVWDSQTLELVTTVHDAVDHLDRTAKERQRPGPLPPHRHEVATSPSGTIATRNRDDSIELFDWHAAQRHQPSLRRLGSFERDGGFALSADGHTLAVGCVSQNAVQIVDLKTHARRSISGDRPMPAFFWCDDRELVGSEGRDIKFWNIADGTTRRSIPADLLTLRTVTWHPPTDLLATAGNDRQIKLWKAQTGELQRVLPGHVEPVITLDFSPDGRSLVSAGHSRTIKVWHVATGAPLCELPLLPDQCQRLQFSPDGRILMAQTGAGHSSSLVEYLFDLTAASPTRGPTVFARRSDGNVFQTTLGDPEGRWNRVATGWNDFAEIVGMPDGETWVRHKDGRLLRTRYLGEQNWSPWETLVTDNREEALVAVLGPRTILTILSGIIRKKTLLNSGEWQSQVLNNAGSNWTQFVETIPISADTYAVKRFDGMIIHLRLDRNGDWTDHWLYGGQIHSHYRRLFQLGLKHVALQQTDGRLFLAQITPDGWTNWLPMPGEWSHITHVWPAPSAR